MSYTSFASAGMLAISGTSCRSACPGYCTAIRRTGEVNARANGTYERAVPPACGKMKRVSTASDPERPRSVVDDRTGYTSTRSAGVAPACREIIIDDRCGNRQIQNAIWQMIGRSAGKHPTAWVPTSLGGPGHWPHAGERVRRACFTILCELVGAGPQNFAITRLAITNW